MLVLLNALDNTRYYIGSYVRDARLRPSKAVQQLWNMAAASAVRRAEAAAMVHHHYRPARRLPQGVLGHPQC